jgi:hypothetical protein
MPEISDEELKELIARATSIYNSLSEEDRKIHDRAQAIDWVRGNLSLSGKVYTHEEIAKIYDKYQEEKQ